MQDHLSYDTKVITGPLLKDIIERFSKKKNGLLGEKPKLYAYSAHDTTLAAMLSTLGIYPAEFPRYASAVLLELHKKEGKFVIEIYHKNMTDVDDVYRYLIPDCPIPCTLESLQSTVEKYLPDDWKSECGLAGPNAVGYMSKFCLTLKSFRKNIFASCPSVLT
ncbi:hypothetical protein OESDEN_02198 [Oesophagostomum dentatum]|uniref:Histidine acid phosphatase n=1 Tax=Oesophagostomum dentatum TaxID=61180 RepID=A0A0B1TKN6_OESDE|nr:hypothetical protein OESDEN_02198 [Oesophagostomum dentatum]